jgi:hypothetical protein
MFQALVDPLTQRPLKPVKWQKPGCAMQFKWSSQGRPQHSNMVDRAARLSRKGSVDRRMTQVRLILTRRRHHTTSKRFTNSRTGSRHP